MSPKAAAEAAAAGRTFSRRRHKKHALESNQGDGRRGTGGERVSELASKCSHFGERRGEETLRTAVHDPYPVRMAEILLNSCTSYYTKDGEPQETCNRIEPQIDTLPLPKEIETVLDEAKSTFPLSPRRYRLTTQVTWVLLGMKINY